MNKLVSIFFLGFLLVACTNDDQGELTILPDPWGQPHRQMMGLEGSVSQVVEKASEWRATEADVEEFILAEYRFNTAGRLVYYNPTGIDPAPSSRWVGVSAAYYEYKYDKDNRLSEADVYEVGEKPRHYQITYGNHDCYVPLIFPLGPFNFFLVKGVESIKSSDGTIDYRFDENKASYSTQSWGKSIETTFEYEKEGRYPSRQLINTTRNGEILSKSTTTYTFDIDGNLLSSSRQIQEEDEEGETLQTSYLKNRFQQVSTMKSSLLDTTIEWE